MRKLLIFLGRVPNSIRKISAKVLQVTTKMLELLESDVAITATKLIPGESDESLRIALIMALQAFESVLKDAKTRRERKSVAKQMATYMVAKIDGNQMPLVDYDHCFERVFQEQKTA